MMRNRFFGTYIALLIVATVGGVLCIKSIIADRVEFSLISDFDASETEVRNRMLALGFHYSGRKKISEISMGTDLIEVTYTNGEYDVVYHYLFSGRSTELSQISIRRQQN